MEVMLLLVKEAIDMENLILIRFVYTMRVYE